MEHVTEYSISVNGKVDPDWPTTRDKNQAREDRDEWLDLSPDDMATIVHRRVVIHDWVTTTP